VRHGRWLRTLLLVTLVLGAGQASADPATPRFKRGGTLVEFFQFPVIVGGSGAGKVYADPAFPRALSSLSLFDFDALRRSGFDHMRIPLDVGPLMQGRGAQWNEIMGQFRYVIATLHRHGLGVIVTLLPPGRGGQPPTPQLDGIHGPQFERYVTIVKRIAVELAAIKSGVVALDPMNEPQDECRASSGPDWTDYQEVLVAQVRRVAHSLPLFLTGGCWSSIEGTVLLDTPLLRDPRNFVSVHFYIPVMFTQQTATWSMPFEAGVTGLPYPAAAGNVDRTLASTLARFQTLNLPPEQKRAEVVEAEKAIRWYFTEGDDRSTIEQWMTKLADWQAREDVPSDHIVFTEFGAMKQMSDGTEIDPDSRTRWLHDTSAAIRRHGWGWTVYVLRDGPYGLYADESDSGPDPRLLSALGLSPVVQ